MKKRLLCIMLAVLLVIPMIFASCDDTRSDEEIIESILSGATTALTLSIWIPTESDTSDPEFVERLNNVEAAINAILIEKNYSTKVDLVAISDDEYETKVAERYAQMSNGHSAGDAYRTAQDYVNSVEKFWPDKANDPDTYIYQIKYPDVLDYQMDIFLIRGYEDFINHYDDGNLKDLSNYISIHGSDYSNINKLIRPNILAQMKIDGKTYAIPNNHLYIDKYQYVVIDKALFDSSEFEIDNIKNLYDAKAFISSLAGTSDVVPFLGTMQDASGTFFIDPDLYFGATVGSPVGNLFENEEYKKFVSFYKGLCEENCVGTTLENNQVAAVQLFNGTKEEAEAKFSSDEYYLIGTPIAGTSTVYESMFAISSYSADPDRAMKVLYLLENDVEIRTLIQYGIEDVDYNISFDDNGEKIIHLKSDTPYKMNVYNTGNPYYTFPADNTTINDWAETKDLNTSVVVDPLIAYDYILASGKVSEEQLSALQTASDEIKAVYAGYLSSIENLSKSDFDEFAQINFVEIYDVIKARLAEIDAERELIQEYEAKLEETTDEDEIEEINNDIEASNAYIDELTAEIEEMRTEISKFQFTEALYLSEAYETIVGFYVELQAIRGN